MVIKGAYDLLAKMNNSESEGHANKDQKMTELLKNLSPADINAVMYSIQLLNS